MTLEKIKRLFKQANQAHPWRQIPHYSPEEQAFLNLNHSELDQKVKAGWFFFHHSWVLNPILALSLGADPTKQVYLYGFGATLALKHGLTMLGGISFQNYFSVIYALYPLYFFMFLAVLYLIFKRVAWVCLGAILLGTGFLMLGYQMIVLAPGYNPMRHLFDGILILLFFTYLKKGRMLNLVSLLLGGGIAIIWSKDFGLFILLSSLTTVMIRMWVTSRQNYGHFLLAMLGLVIACVLYLLPCHGVNYNLLYMLLGCTLPDTSLTKICMLLTGIGLGYVFFVSYRKWESDYYWLSLNLFFYLQMQLLYYVWYPSTAHFLVLAPTIILGCLAVLAFLCKPKQDAIPGLNLAVVVSLIGLYIPSYYKFYQEKMTHQQLFATHVVHDWRFPYAQFQTTMEPNLFADTRQLIDKYSSLPAIYLLSKYDAIIPVLVQRYNRLPVVNLALDLISQRDITRCKQVIDQDKPQYLFVDSDSHRDMRGDILVAGDDREYSESYGRFGVMRNLKSLFDQIREDYVLQESGSLISVYKRKVGV